MINSEIVAMCRVDITTNGTVAAYGFSNGFETESPVGATAGSDPIEVVAAGNYILYLTDPVMYGSATEQGGLVACAFSADTGAVVPGIAFCTVAHGDTTGEGAEYAGVDARKKIHVRGYDGAVPALSATMTGLTVIVYRNPVTLIA